MNDSLTVLFLVPTLCNHHDHITFAGSDGNAFSTETIAEWSQENILMLRTRRTAMRSDDDSKLLMYLSIFIFTLDCEMVLPPCHAGGDIIAGSLVGGGGYDEDMDPGELACPECDFELDVDGGCSGK